MSRFGMPPLSVVFNYIEFSSTDRQKYLKSIASEVVTQMPLTVSVGEDALVIEALARHFRRRTARGWSKRT